MEDCVAINTVSNTCILYIASGFEEASVDTNALSTSECYSARRPIKLIPDGQDTGYTNNMYLKTEQEEWEEKVE